MSSESILDFAMLYAPQSQREGMRILFRLDEQLGNLIRGSKETSLAQIKLTWWHEALLHCATPHEKESPLLEQVRTVVEHYSLSPEDIAALTDGWVQILAPLPLTDEALKIYAEERGGRLFTLIGQLSGNSPAWLADSGAAWALADLAARMSDEVTAHKARKLAQDYLIRPRPARIAKDHRALGFLTLMVSRNLTKMQDETRSGTMISPGMALRGLWHYLSGF